MPPLWQAWFHEHIYTAMLVASLLEGLGLPVPAEAIYIAAAGPAHRGVVSLPGVVLAGVVGNLVGALAGFGLAYLGGQVLMARICRILRLEVQALSRVQIFFARYGAAAVFLSRFAGVLRAPAIYSAGAARMEPWRFACYSAAAAVVWNVGWAWLAYRFGRHVPALLARVSHLGLGWVVALAFLVILGYLFRDRIRS